MQHRQELGKINVLSYNVYMRPLVYSNNGDFKDKRLGIFLDKFVNHFDIIALQELFQTGSYRSDQMIEQCEKLGLRYHVNIERSLYSMKPIDSGLFIFSRFPIVEKDLFVFTQGKGIDGWTTKGVLSALVQITDQTRVLVVNTHLQADYDSNNSEYYQIQVSQLLEIRQFLEKKRREYPDVPIIMMGDFNVNARLMEDNDVVVGQSDSYLLLRKILSLKDGSYLDQNLSTILSEEDRNQLQREYENLQVVQHDWRDLVKECYGGTHPVTFGDAKRDANTGKIEPVETVLTNSAMLCTRLRLDYIFYYNPLDADVASNIGVLKDQIDTSQLDASYTNTHFSSSESVESRIPKSEEAVPELFIVKPGTARVEPFFVQDDEVKQLSDHYALTCSFAIVHSTNTTD